MSIIDKIKGIFNEIKEEGKVLKGDKAKDKLYSSKKPYSDESKATEAFIEAKERLFNVNAWSKIPAIVNSSFSLYDTNGFPLGNKKPVMGDFIKIVLPGPIPENWVKVIDIKDAENLAEFTVCPSHDPTAGRDKTKVEHFLDNEATSTFRVERQGSVIHASEIGKNETINNSGEQAGDRKIVNTLIAQGGWAGFQKYQWENLTDYLVDCKGDS